MRDHGRDTEEVPWGARRTWGPVRENQAVEETSAVQEAGLKAAREPAETQRGFSGDARPGKGASH